MNVHSRSLSSYKHNFSVISIPKNAFKTAKKQPVNVGEGFSGIWKKKKNFSSVAE